MAKGIALTRIEHGMLDKDGKNVVRVFEEGDDVVLPDAAMRALVDSKAVALPPGTDTPAAS